MTARPEPTTSQTVDRIEAVLGRFSTQQAALMQLWYGCTSLLAGFPLHDRTRERLHEMLDAGTRALEGELLTDEQVVQVMAELTVRVAERREHRHAVAEGTAPNAVIRAWAQEHGYPVNPTGPVRNNVAAAYRAAHAPVSLEPGDPNGRNAP